MEEKRHLRHQDVGVVVEQLNRRRADLPADHAHDRLLLLAPHVRPQQAAVLERAEIDYLDLAGNAHLQAPGLFVHVEGRQPRKEPMAAPGRPQKGWIKTVMAILIRPELTNAPYRTLADRADVARLQLEEGFSFNMAGFGQVVPNCILISIDGGPTVPVAPLALYVLLKLVAFGDRNAGRASRTPRLFPASETPSLRT